jgi:EAL domain-containing protein (putative c-di-GMP-specific phosphodiesterase class I)
MTATSNNATIVKAAIGMAHELGIDVVVEGVNTAEQVVLIRSWGCRKIQGFYFSTPLSAAETAAALRGETILPRQSVRTDAAA